MMKMLFTSGAAVCWELNLLVTYGEGPGLGPEEGCHLTLVAKNGNRFCLDVCYTGSYRICRANAPVSDVRKEDVPVDTVRQPFTVSEELVYD